MNKVKIKLIIFIFILPNILVAQKRVKEMVGTCSFYSDKFQGKKTSSGENYDKNLYTGAHKWLPFNTLVEVTNLKNDSCVVVRINDRGPHSKARIIDVSGIAAKKLKFEKYGITKVRLRIIGNVLNEELDKKLEPDSIKH
jgi:rare lipoprotein A